MSLTLEPLREQVVVILGAASGTGRETALGDLTGEAVRLPGLAP